MKSMILPSLLVLTLAACGAQDQSDTPASVTPVTPTSTPATSPLMGAIDRQTIETATFQTPTTPQPTRPTTPTSGPATAPGEMRGEAAASNARPDPALIRAQILLDRARFSPGVVDGLGGDNTRQAIAAFEKANALPDDGVLDAAVFQRLVQTDAQKVLADYTITAADIAGPFIGQVPADLEAMSKLDAVGYANVREALAEKFHMTEAMLAALNPGVDFNRAGQVIVVPAVTAAKLPGQVARITVDKTERSVRAYDEAGTLLAFYPATIGSSERPAPSGTVTVVGVAPEPNYTYDPSRVSYDRGDRKLVVPAGPNNPVGSVWIDLSRDTYGIHGTPDPSKVGKTFSSGCVRLTNWNAEQLAASVKSGVVVRFI